MIDLTVGDTQPRRYRDAFIAVNAALIGDVSVGLESSIWFGAVLRADAERIEVGDRSNVQDNAVIHTDDGFPVVIGDGVSVGHGAVLHGCRVGDDCLIGMNATVLDGSVIGAGSLVAAGAVVLEGMLIPPGSLVAGVPARVRRELSPEEALKLRENATLYVRLAREHRHQSIDP